ncbi:hypothetical protein [Syntrophaceticus schinkii]|uniref:Uncharacterized protein n=1 Tax=Syntrophaceticus schinkii TaxID=499207 RepID=A0A0B7MLG0_9FIRM|nr:hypothetical protein [Syntrophaceticus schinkii]MDD2358821.1 hypothetical protein [Syntrophaceticus schinkii]MDD4261127.1 hypothetical protein [Syntrophaceticus schinkii]CEO88756.1 hypothetical protein SSCH_2520007 [Syntrophaceticus schinkii]CEO88766.1 hypothetical protein SSCH_2550001 [Syntrophaceticus schinkii]
MSFEIVRDGKADSFRPEEGNISAGDRGEQAGTSPESKTLARCTQLVHGNLGDPAGSSEEGVWQTSDTK